jgi:hypothetical protein
MYPLRIFLQRNRKLLMRLAALFVLGAGGMVAVLPRADAHPNAAKAAAGPLALLLAPQPVASRHFALLTPPSQP